MHVHKVHNKQSYGFNPAERLGRRPAGSTNRSVDYTNHPWSLTSSMFVLVEKLARAGLTSLRLPLGKGTIGSPAEIAAAKSIPAIQHVMAQQRWLVQLQEGAHPLEIPRTPAPRY